jgi:hypothetical protein
MPEAGRVVGHRIQNARDMGDLRQVAVVAPVEGKQTQKVRRRAIGRDRGAPDPGNSRRVVTKGCQGKLAAVGDVCQDILVTQNSREFEVRIGDGPIGVAEGDERGLDVCGERLAPQEGRGISVVGTWDPDAPHASTGSIRSAHVRGLRGNNLRDTDRAFTQAGSEVLKVLEGVVNRLGQLDATLVGDAERQLQLSEHTSAAGDGERHAA